MTSNHDIVSPMGLLSAKDGPTPSLRRCLSLAARGDFESTGRALVGAVWSGRTSPLVVAACFDGIRLAACGRTPAMQPTLRNPRPLHVAIVSKNPETLEGLESYLRGAGVLTSSTRAIARAAELGARASALVLFPDDFTWDGAVSALAKCRSQNPRAPLVLVTRTPQRFEALAGPDDGALTVVVPKPAWSWTILDAIRAHLDDEPERERD